MEEVDEFLSSERSRREVLAGAGSAAVAAIAGCSGDENNNTENPGSNSTDGATDEPGSGEESDPTGTEGGSSGTEDGNQSTGEGNSGTEESGPESYDDDESQAEIEGEDILTNNYLGWIEFEDPSEQLPQDNYSIEEYPSLAALISEDSESSEANFNVYEDDFETVYFMWLEDGDLEGDGIGILIQGVEDFDGQIHQDYSGSHTDQGADLEGILRNVVEGYNDVSPNLDEEYAEILGAN